MTDIYADALNVGDVIVVHGISARVTEIEPYEHPTVPHCLGFVRTDIGYDFTVWRTTPIRRLP